MVKLRRNKNHIFQAEHSKTYKDAEEESMRFGIFKEALKFIEGELLCS